MLAGHWCATLVELSVVAAMPLLMHFHFHQHWRAGAQVFLGKLSVMACSGVIALLMSDLDYYSNPAKYPGTYLTSPLLPVLLSMLIGYIVGAMFFNVRTCPLCGSLQCWT